MCRDVISGSIRYMAGFRARQQAIDIFFVYPYFSQSLKHISYITTFYSFFVVQSFNLDVYLYVFCYFNYFISFYLYIYIYIYIYI